VSKYTTCKDKGARSTDNPNSGTPLGQAAKGLKVKEVGDTAIQHSEQVGTQAVFQAIVELCNLAYRFDERW